MPSRYAFLTHPNQPAKCAPLGTPAKRAPLGTHRVWGIFIAKMSNFIKLIN
jgi:hypothetical protein